MDGAGSDIVVTAAATRFELTPGVRFTFGRARDCTVCLDPEDTGISRLAGSVAYAGQSWWLTNASTKRALTVVDDRGLPATLHPGRRIALETSVRVVVEGTHGSHYLAVAPTWEADRAADADAAAAAGASTAVGEEVLFQPDDRKALVALFAGFLLDPPHYDPHPRTYEAAAHRLGWTRTKLLRRIEYLRGRLTRAGVPNMHGHAALYSLAEYALSRKLITAADLAILPQQPIGSA